LDFRRFLHAAIFCAAIITAAAGIAAAQTPDRPGGPAAALEAFLRYDVPGYRRAVFDYRKPTPLMRQLLSKSLVTDWFSAMRYNDKFPVFDANPFDGMQESGGSRVLTVSTQSDDGDTAVVTATLGPIVEGRIGAPHQQKYVLKNEDGTWKIDDIVYKPALTLRAHLKAVVAQNAGAVPASPPAPPQAAGSTASANAPAGKYCIGNGSIMLLTRPSADGGLEFGFSSWNARGHYFGIFGASQPEPSGWRFREHMNSADPKERCEAIIARLPDGGYSFSVTTAGQCESSGGYGAAPLPNQEFQFPARARQGTMPRDKPMAEAMSLESGGVSCKTLQRNR
jgi:hypothetical protein